jgi:hypothetical protein
MAPSWAVSRAICMHTSEETTGDGGRCRITRFPRYVYWIGGPRKASEGRQVEWKDVTGDNTGLYMEGGPYLLYVGHPESKRRRVSLNVTGYTLGTAPARSHQHLKLRCHMCLDNSPHPALSLSMICWVSTWEALRKSSPAISLERRTKDLRPILQT